MEVSGDSSWVELSSGCNDNDNDNDDADATWVKWIKHKPMQRESGEETLASASPAQVSHFSLSLSRLVCCLINFLFLVEQQLKFPTVSRQVITIYKIQSLKLAGSTSKDEARLQKFKDRLLTSFEQEKNILLADSWIHLRFLFIALVSDFFWQKMVGKEKTIIIIIIITLPSILQWSKRSKDGISIGSALMSIDHSFVCIWFALAWLVGYY